MASGIATQQVGKTTTTSTPWWKTAVVYQIYPYSFLDTTGSGTGDLNGITQKLPYIRSIGVDVIWLCPIYASPMKDMGYDISDYSTINPDMGTMADWERLVSEAHKIGLKVVMDLVVNHTSDQHEWFTKSERRDPGFEDFYYWSDGKLVPNPNPDPSSRDTQVRQEPNNWGAIFGGSAWEWSPIRNQYYLHVFETSQPDLNWTTPQVRAAVWSIMRFWLDKGCDGFRMDVINGISKEPGFPDVPVTDQQNKWQYGLLHRFNGPKVVEYLHEMAKEVLDQYPDVFTVGETPGLSPETSLPFVKAGRPLQMIFHFEHMHIDEQPNSKCFNYRPWRLTELKTILSSFMTYNQTHDGWDSLYVENHDQPRILGRWASDSPEHRLVAAKMLALFHATGRGTLFLYQGQELGMANPKTWTVDELRDVEEINWYNEQKGRRAEGADMDDILKQIQYVGRDNSRTLMQWAGPETGGEYAGFTTNKGKPWIKVNPDFRDGWNAEAEEKDSNSALSFWKSLLEFRKENVELVTGWFEMVDPDNEQVYAYTRGGGSGEKNKFLVVCSFSKTDVEWECPIDKVGSLVLRNYDQRGDELTGFLKLRPYEGRLYRL